MAGFGEVQEQYTKDLERDLKQARKEINDLEAQLAEAREEIKDLQDIKNRMFSMMQMAYVDHEAFKPLFESMCNMIKEELKEKGE